MLFYVCRSDVVCVSTSEGLCHRSFVRIRSLIGSRQKLCLITIWNCTRQHSLGPRTSNDISNQAERTDVCDLHQNVFIWVSSSFLPLESVPEMYYLYTYSIAQRPWSPDLSSLSHKLVCRLGSVHFR